MEVWTVGLEGRSAAHFFGLLDKHNLRHVVDVRMPKPDGYGGFVEPEDLAWFIPRLSSADYRHDAEMAPTQVVVDRVLAHGGEWDFYREELFALFDAREIGARPPSSLKERSVLLCSSPDHERCHRSLVLEYLATSWGPIEAVNL